MNHSLSKKTRVLLLGSLLCVYPALGSSRPRSRLRHPTRKTNTDRRQFGQPANSKQIPI